MTVSITLNNRHCIHKSRGSGSDPVAKILATPRVVRELLLTFALICGALLTSASAEEWAVPDIDGLPMDAFGGTVRVGRDLIVHTAATIGPDASDSAKRFSGNGLECQSCHLDAGRKKFGLPLAGVWGLFPQFISRENEVRTLEAGSTVAWSAA